MNKALILEDMPESQDLLRQIAMAAFPNIECVCVADIANAKKLMNQGFNLALIDLSLPDGSGTIIIQQLAQNFPACTVVVATIFDDDDHLFPALRAGAHGYLLKDESPDLLIQQLQRISAGHPPLSPSVARRMLTHFRRIQETVRIDTTTLTPRERQVLVLLAQGISLTIIAVDLSISRHTVGDHVKNIYRKLNISSRAEAALRAQNMGLV
jgi:DNA-binding NarL/FixJ family response regulator